jgi:hypothetical protein
MDCGFFGGRHRLRKDPVILAERGSPSSGFGAAGEVLDGASVIEVACRFKVSRQGVHVWLRPYAADQVLCGCSEFILSAWFTRALVEGVHFCVHPIVSSSRAGVSVPCRGCLD